MVVIIFMHGVRRSAHFVFRASTLVLQRVFDFQTDVQTKCVKIMTNLFGRGLVGQKSKRKIMK